MSAIYDATHHEPSTSPSHRLHLLTAVADRLEIRPPRECLLQPIVSTGSSTQGTKTVLHPVFDLATAKAVYAALFGGPPQTDSSYKRRLRGRGPAHPAGAGRWIARHTVTGPRRQRPRAASGPLTSAA
jgi:hypothetical protein